MCARSPRRRVAPPQFARALHGHVAQDRRMHEFVHQSHLQCLLRPDVLAREDHLEGRLQAHQPRQSLRAGRRRQQPQLHLGKREDRLGMVGDDAVRAGQRHLEPAPQRRAVDGRDGRCAQRRRADPAAPGRRATSASPSAAARMRASSSMSAPAIHESALPLKITTAVMAVFALDLARSIAPAPARSREFSVLTGAPGAS